MTPQRIQRKRTKGWKQPPLTKYLGRGTAHGNEYVIGKDGTRDECLQLFRGRLEAMIQFYGARTFVQHYLEPLAPYENLSCFCPLDVPCHVDIWIEYMNRYGVTPQPAPRLDAGG
jgi:uncharacterized protein DUF4326